MSEKKELIDDAIFTEIDMVLRKMPPKLGEGLNYYFVVTKNCDKEERVGIATSSSLDVKTRIYLLSQLSEKHYRESMDENLKNSFN